MDRDKFTSFMRNNSPAKCQTIGIVSDYDALAIEDAVNEKQNHTYSAVVNSRHCQIFFVPVQDFLNRYKIEDSTQYQVIQQQTNQNLNSKNSWRQKVYEKNVQIRPISPTPSPQRHHRNNNNNINNSDSMS